MSGRKIRVAAIDDDKMLLSGLSAWLTPVDDIELAAVATSVDAYEADPPDAPVEVILLDLNLRDLSRPADNVARLLGSGAAVLVVSTVADAGHVIATLEAGAAGYVTKDNDLPVLIDAVRRVAAGESVVTPELAFVLARDERPARPRLSAQERAVLLSYATGSTLEAAARRAGVAYGTAREYLQRVKRKYTEAGRPAYTKLDLAQRVREDRLELDRLPDPHPDPEVTPGPS
ncbi:response regulator transcription factor [Streptomyces sp. NPDC093085]|uniref:response regulator transcription factor n=1 Tax=Streptomyces sp. NPDC093085 TaxID=3155068 RepID=UPI003418B82D